MMRWLDALGWAKWPSLILIASPIAAYSSWVPDQAPADDCGIVAVGGSRFHVHRRADGAFVLRPTREAKDPAIALAAATANGFDSGGMVMSPDEDALAAIICRRAKSA